jgi:hypothetical protein
MRERGEVGPKEAEPVFNIFDTIIEKLKKGTK